jgi:hypothetical protein
MIDGMKLLVTLIGVIALMVRYRLFPLPADSRQRIYDELHRRLKVSAPYLYSTLDSVSFDSGSTTAR